MSLFVSAPPLAASKPLTFLSGPPCMPTRSAFTLGADERLISLGAASGGGFAYRRNGGLFLRKERKGAVVGRSVKVVCSASVLHPETLQWISAISSVVLMLARGAAIHKSFLVPLFALQAPATVISWIKGEYGTWTAFILLLIRLFYFIPGELELPLHAIILLIIAPHQPMSLRGTPAGAVISLAIAGFLAYQHFSKIGSLRKSFEPGSIVATIALSVSAFTQMINDALIGYFKPRNACILYSLFEDIVKLHSPELQRRPPTKRKEKRYWKPSDVFPRHQIGHLQLIVGRRGALPSILSGYLCRENQRFLGLSWSKRVESMGKREAGCKE